MRGELQKNLLIICGTSAANDDKNDPEQKAIPIDKAEYEQAFEGDTELASELVKNLQKCLRTFNLSYYESYRRNFMIN